MSFSFGVHVEYLPKSASSPRPHDSHGSGAMKVVIHQLRDASHVDSKTLIAQRACLKVEKANTLLLLAVGVAGSTTSTIYELPLTSCPSTLEEKIKMGIKQTQ